MVGSSRRPATLRDDQSRRRLSPAHRTAKILRLGTFDAAVSVSAQRTNRKARRAAFGQCIARLQQASGAAVSTLLKVMVDPSTPASVKVRAADSILDHSAKDRGALSAAIRAEAPMTSPTLNKWNSESP